MSRPALGPLVPLYRAAVAAKDHAYRQRWLKPRRLRFPVISIGNLSIGGAGKTPLTIRLAELLAAQGFQVDVLSRGYGRSSRATERVNPAGNASRFGDEPLLIARRTGAAVFVGASRYHAGVLAELQLSPGARAVHLLDDGFQHRQLARGADIVIVHRSDFTGRLLPAGRLREPLAALRRASFIVLREQDADLQDELRKLRIPAPLWWMRRTVALAESDLSGRRATTPARAIAFCGIARPAEFFAAAAGIGLHLAETFAFADHHRYSRRHIESLVNSASRNQADTFITTEKDAVKLDAALRNILEQAAPLRIVRLSVSLRDEACILQQLLEKLAPA